MTSIPSIQKEILDNGPVMVTIELYEDMLFYNSGIYENVAGNFLTNHNVRVYGWAHDNNRNLYWYV